MKTKMKIITLLSLSFFVSSAAYSQCETWIDSPNKDTAENAHVVYRDAMKANDFALAFTNWEIAYKLAPAADGKRASHYIDGIELYKNKLTTETDDAKKEEYKAAVVRLYDELISCYEAKAISIKCDTDDCYDVKIGQTLGRKAYDMYYTSNSPYGENLEVLQMAMEKSGDDAEYVVFAPAANIVVYQFEKGLVEKDAAVKIYKQLEGIAEYGIANNERLSAYYEQAWQSAQGTFSKIEADIFDCEYFKEKYQSDLESNPDDPELAKTVYNVLKARGCDDNDPLVVKMKKQYETWAAGVNAQRQAEFESNNPGVMAKKLYDQGDFSGAIAKYRSALSEEADPAKQASYHFSIASILYRKLKKYSEARNEAKQAASKRPGWGRPYMLIGDMYGQSARMCGDSWNQRLAILAAMDKYSYAKSLDAEVAQEASERLAKYRASMPEQSEGFMRSVKAGDSVSTGCWIGETVTIRFK